MKRMIALMLCFILAFTLCPSVFAVGDGTEPEEDVCEIDGTGYATLDAALTAVPSGETIKLLEGIDYNSGVVIEDKSITFDLNGFNLNVVNNAEGDSPEEMSGLYVKGNAAVSLEGEGEFNVTGAWYGVFAECESENDEMASATVTNATGIERDGVAAQSSKVTVRGNVTSSGAGSRGVWASYENAEVIVEGNVYADGDMSVGVYADTVSSVTANGSVIVNGADSIGVRACEDADVTVDGDVAVSGSDCVGAFLLSEAGKASIIAIKGGIDAEKYVLVDTGDDEIEHPFDQGRFNADVSEDCRYYTEDYYSFVYVALFAGGSGTAEDPYLISRGTQLANINEYYYIDKHYKQIADIDLDRYFGYGEGWNPIGNGEVPFNGTYDGDGHTISNLYINRSDSDNIGLFAYIGTGGIIRNVGLIDVDITGEDSAGTLAGGNTGLVEDAYATGEVSGDGDAVGGLIGINDGTITGSYFDGTVTSVEGNASGDFAGGLIGINYENGTITDCYAIAAVTSEGNCIGGLVGANSGPINDSHALCSVSGNETAGGLVGENSSIGIIDNSYADGTVTGNVRVGGFAGLNDFMITDSYFTGTVTASGDYSGGLTGESRGSIEGCHADATVTSTGDYVGGLAGYSRGAANSYATGSVTGGSFVGGMIGESYRSSPADVIDASYSTSTVTGSSYIGGLVGSNEIDISASYAKGSVTGVEEGGSGCEYAGGLVGNNTAPIRNSYAWGNISGHEYVGGLVGYNEGNEAAIFNCYEIGAVDGNDGSYVGPLIGRVNLLSHEDIVGSFWNNNTSGQVSSDWGISKGSVSMKQQVTYINEDWNFDAIWGINTVDNDGYPFLRWQNTAEFAGGSGTEADPYLVATADHLNNVRDHLDQHFRQIEHVDLSFYRSDSGWVPIGTSTDRFTGIYDGNGYTIGNLFIDQVGVWDVRNPAGLFGYTGAGAEICNLTLENADITGCYYVGSLVGNNGGEILDVSISGSVTGEWDTGGLAGLNSGSITGSAFTGTVSGADEIEYGDWTGGLVGYNTGGTITKCQVNATVVSEGDSVGGLAGESLNDAAITESCAMGSVSASSYVGGLVGSNDGEITACYSTCSVNGNSDIGGLAGGNSGLIGDSYAVGAVAGTNRIGGLAVNSSEEDITNCYWDTEETGQSNSAGGTGKTTAEMKQLATFENWDFVTIWDIDTSFNNGYPFLRWQIDVPPILSETGVDSATDTTAALSFTSDKTGTYYYLVYEAAEDAPDTAAIKAQGEAVAKGTGTAAAAANAVGLIGLTASTEYNVYIIVEYTEWNTSAIAAINFTTEAVPTEFAGGSGTEGDPFLVATADQLNNVRNHLDKHFIQTHDINLSGYSTGEGWEPIGDNSTPFTGTYDGNEFSIDNLFIERDDDYSGLFGYIAVNGNVSDLSLDSVDVTSSSDNVGGLAGRNNGLITNCSVAGSVSINGWNNPIGGLAGENHGAITNCSFHGTVESDDDYTGGLVGWDQGSIINCHTTGTVRGDDEVGGLVGYKVNGDIRESYSECAVEAVNDDSTQTGGLVGNNDGEIDSCYALGAVTGNEYVGGLVGYNYSPGGVIVHSYAAGTVNGNDNVGGLAGSNSHSITDCYWNTETSGQSTSAGGEGKTTAEMKQQETFSCWDFATVWGINSTDNGGYPFLRWQGYVHGNPVLTAPTAPQNSSATPGDGQVALSWTAPASDGGDAISRYEVSGDNGGTWVTAGANTSHTFTGLTNGTAYTFKVRAVNSAGPGAEASATATPAASPVYAVNFYSNGSLYASKTVTGGSDLGTNWPDNPTRSGYSFGGWFDGQNGAGTRYESSTTVAADVDLYAKWTYNDGGSSDGGSGTPTTPAYKADVSAENNTETTLPIMVDEDIGIASVDAGSQGLDEGGTVITIPSIPGVDTYSVGIPLPDLSTGDVRGTLTVNTDVGNVTVPSNMLTGVSGIGGSKAQITIGQGDKAMLPEDVKTAIGDRPFIQLTLSIDGKQTGWSNPNAPVTVSIPYVPTAAELANPENIVVWYIDGSGNVVAIPNGYYDPATGMVTFDTTHFSDYAVAYHKVSFHDVAAGAWYHKAVSFIAARGITGGTDNGTYSPNAGLTRGEFIVMLMKACGIEADVNFTNNFLDAGNTRCTGCLAAAKRLGITAGVGNNMFAPEKEITRQEMFTLLYNALKVIGQLPQGDSNKTLSNFSDAAQIDSWAKEAMTLLVKTGTVAGNAGKLNPISTTTRAEMAQVLYNLLSK